MSFSGQKKGNLLGEVGFDFSSHVKKNMLCKANKFQITRVILDNENIFTVNFKLKHQQSIVQLYNVGIEDK